MWFDSYFTYKLKRLFGTPFTALTYFLADNGFSSDIGNRYPTFFRKGDGPGLCIDRWLFIKIKPQRAYKDYTSKKPEATTQHLHT
jgi:hypothetical protein